MKKDTHHFFLGIFVMTGAALIAAVVTILGAETLFEEYTQMETYIEESVSGLERGSPVKFRGIPVGEVVEITTVGEYYDTQKSYALIRVKVKTDRLNLPGIGDVNQTIADRVRRGLRVSLASSGVTGSSYIETEYISDSAKYPELPIDWQPEQIYVPSTPSTLQRLETSLDTVLDNLSRTDLQGVVAAARDTMRQMEASMADLDFKGLSTKAQELLQRTSQTVAAAGRDLDRLTGEINTTLQQVRGHVDTTFAAADRTLQRVDGALDQGRLTTSLQRLESLLANADRAVQELRTVARSTGRTVDGVNQIVRGRSRELQVAIGNLRGVLQNLNSLTGMLVEYPSLLFLGNPPRPARSVPKEDK